MAATGIQELARFFFRPQGRIGRVEYSLGVGFITAINLAILSALFLYTDANPGAMTIAAAIGFPLTVALLFLVAKRCHDFGLPGSFVLLIAVPGVGLLWLIALAIIPGEAGPNLYGAPPRFDPD